MRMFILAFCAGLLGCATTTEYISGPLVDTISPRTHKYEPVSRDQRVVKSTAPEISKQSESEPEWSITEDRFITTHGVDFSAAELHRSKESITKRLEQLDKKSSN